MKGNDDMSIQSITQQVQDNEQYKIRKQTAERSEQTQQAQAQVQVQAETSSPKTDTYDKANPAGESVEGIYSVSHDDEGNLKVNYTQPKASGNSSGAKASSESGSASGAKASSGTSQVSTSSDDDDEELEELKKQEEQLKAQLNRETDEGARQALRTQLQSVEMQIAMKSAGVNS
jgi:hypothetical protein